MKKRIIIISASILGVIVLALGIFVFFDVEGFIYRNQIISNDFEGAEDWEIPTIGIDTDRLERLTHGRTIVRPAFAIGNNGTLLTWRLNGRFLPRTFGVYFVHVQEDPPGETVFRNILARTITLREGENELLIRARGTSGLITERRIIITSDQTTPQRLRIVPLFHHASIDYDPENPMLVTLTIEIEEGDFGNVLLFAETYDYEREFFDVIAIDERTFELAVELVLRGQRLGVDSYGQDVRLILENKWGTTWGGVSIRLAEDGSLISDVHQGGSTQGLIGSQWATSLPFPKPSRPSEP
jgi:hypothetical protein